MAAVEVSPGDLSSGQFDVPRISAFLVVPQKAVEVLATTSDGEAIAAILTALTNKAREYDDLKAEKLRMDVELEQSSRTANTRISSMKSRLDNALLETQELRGKVLEAETAKSSLEAELSDLKNSTSSSSEESRTLRSRISTLEAEKRETLEALDRKNSAYDRLQEDHNQVQTKLIDSRRKINELESKVQQSEAAQSSLRLRDQTLKQEIEILKKNNEWLDGELNAKAAEHAKYRRDKSAQVSKLQHDLEEACSKAGIAERNAELVRERYNEVSRRAEEAQMKIKELNDRIASQEDAFREEIAAAQRLAELWERSATSARKRVTEVETLLENERSAQSEEVGRLQAICDACKEENEHANAKIETLEVQIERLEADLATYAAVQQSSPPAGRMSLNGPSTPRRAGTATPDRMLFSPAAQAIVQSQKTGVSLTQMYTDYAQMKKDLEAANRRNARLQESFDELIQDLEEKAPEIDNMKEELDRTHREIMEMSEFLQEANISRDEAEKEVNLLKARNKKHETEAEILRQQLRDVSSQVRLLLSENQHLSQGFPSFSTADQQRFRALAESGQSLTVVETDTDRLISQRLVLFKNIKELQDQNVDLLKTVRELGKRMEDDEEKLRLEAQGQKSKEIIEMQQALEKYQDEIRNLQARADSFIKERDMFRRMLQNRGSMAPPESPLKIQDLNPQLGDSQMSGSVQPARDDKEDYAQLLRDLQQSFDQYRQEAATDHTTLRDQSTRLQNEKNELQIQVTRINGQLELANNRYEMLNTNYDLLRNENSELQKRNHQLSELQAKLDLKSQQIEEELVDIKSVADSLRNENTHLKAEKELWKSIEDRLSRDNESLVEQRSQLNASISSLQSMQNERERSDAEARRRFQSQVENLENELQTTKRRLNDEVEESKKLMLRKEYESKEAQKRIDDANSALASARESLVAAKTNEDNLKTKADELSIMLKAAEEKLELLQPAKPVESSGGAEEEVSQEQELRIEITELTRQLELAKTDLANAQTDVEKYREISQTSEDALQTMNETYEAYRADMEKALEDRDAKIADLEQRMTDITSELTSANQELSQLRQEQSEKERAHEEEMKLRKSEVASLKEEVNSQMSASRHHQENLKRQAQIAQDAQQSYEAELMKHAQAAEALHKVRAEYAELKTQVYAFKSEAEAAKATLESSKSSWETQKETYEKELRERQTRATDLEKQNKVLHSQFEGVSHQIAELQKNRAQTDGELEIATSDKSLEELREVISYLRREKEIVEVQLELQIREGGRFKQQLEHTQRSLDEARLSLSQERERENAGLRNASQHDELMQRISELNLLRESNSALRTEKDRQIKKVKDLQTKIDEMTAKIQPMEEKIRNFEGEVEVKDGQMRLLQEDNDRWKARTNQILQKYDRIDPAELEALKDQLQSVQEEHDKLTKAVDDKDAEIAEKDSQIQKKEQEKAEVAALWRNKMDKIVTDTKARLAERRKTIEELNATIASLNTRIQELESSLAAVTAERDQSANAASEAQMLSQEKAKWDQERLVLIENAKRNEAEQNAKLENTIQELNTTRAQLEQARQEVTDLRAQLAAASTASGPPGLNANQDVEAEVSRRVAESQANIDAVVAERVAAQLASQQPGQGADPTAMENVIQERIAAEKQKFEEEKKRLRDAFQNSVRNNVTKAHEVKNKEIEEIKKAKAEVESQLEQARKSLAENQSSDPSIVTTSSDEVATLQAQLREAQEKLSSLEETHTKQLEELRQQVQTTASAQVATTEAQTPTKLTPQQQEQMKRIIARNVESRLAKEKEKHEAELAEKIQAAEASQREQTEASIAEMERKLKEQHEEELKAKEAEHLASLEQIKDSARREGEMRANVKLSMQEKKNKQLSDRLKAMEEKYGTETATITLPQAPAPPQQAPVQRQPQQQQQVSAFAQAPPAQTPGNPVSAFGQPGPAPVAAPGSQTPSQQAQASAQPISAFGLPQKPAAPQPQQQQQQQQQQDASKQSTSQAASEATTAHPGFTAGNVGTGPAALRNLRGQLNSGIPRGGAGAGAGRGRGGQQQQQGGHQAHQNQQAAAGQEPVNQFGVPASILEQRQQRFGAIPQPTQGAQQQPQGQGAAQPGGLQSAFSAPQTGLPRGAASGRGAFGRPSRGGPGGGPAGGSGAPGGRVSNIGIAPQTGIPMPGTGAGRGMALNAAAQQFTPSVGAAAAKRVRDDQDQGDEATKRQRLPGEQ